MYSKPLGPCDRLAHSYGSAADHGPAGQHCLYQYLRERFHRDGLIVGECVLLSLHAAMVDQGACISCQTTHGHANVCVHLCHLFDAGGLL